MLSTHSISYNKTAKTLHWLLAALIIFMLALGWTLGFLPNDETKFYYIQLHKSIGITILLLSVFRLLWRFGHKAPPLPPTMARSEQCAAHVGHFLLYAAMIGMPLSGWAMVSASPHNIPTILFGVVRWPALPIVSTLTNKEKASHLLAQTHGTLAYILAILVVGHAAAALKHHFISRDDILLRMVPRTWTNTLNRIRGIK